MVLFVQKEKYENNTFLHYNKHFFQNPENTQKIEIKLLNYKKIIGNKPLFALFLVGYKL